MSGTEFDVVIAAYLIPDLAQQDFDALVKLVTDKQLKVEGVAPPAGQRQRAQVTGMGTSTAAAVWPGSARP
jgi:hypothetical protein